MIMCFFLNDPSTTEIYTYDTLFPYTTLFRSHAAADRAIVRDGDEGARLLDDAAIPFDAILDRPEPRELPREGDRVARSEEHTSELQSLMRISYAVFCLKKKTANTITNH